MKSSGDWWSSTCEHGWVNEDNCDNEIHYNGYSVNGKEVGGWQKGKRKEKPPKEAASLARTPKATARTKVRVYAGDAGDCQGNGHWCGQWGSLCQQVCGEGRLQGLVQNHHDKVPLQTKQSVAYHFETNRDEEEGWIVVEHWRALRVSWTCAT